MKKATEKTGQKLPAENLEENSENSKNYSEKELTVLNRMIEGTPSIVTGKKKKATVGEWQGSKQGNGKKPKKKC